MNRVYLKQGEQLNALFILMGSGATLTLLFSQGCSGSCDAHFLLALSGFCLFFLLAIMQLLNKQKTITRIALMAAVISNLLVGWQIYTMSFCVACLCSALYFNLILSNSLAGLRGCLQVLSLSILLYLHENQVVARIGLNRFRLDELDSRLPPSVQRTLFEARLKVIEEEALSTSINASEAEDELTDQQLEAARERVARAFPFLPEEQQLAFIKKGRKLLAAREKEGKQLQELRNRFYLVERMPRPNIELRPNPVGTLTIGGKQGLPRVTMFTDFDCSACRKMYAQLAGRAEVTYRFMPQVNQLKALALMRSPTVETIGSLMNGKEPVLMTGNSSERESAWLRNDWAEAQRLGLRKTPSLFVNGKPCSSRELLNRLAKLE